MEISLHLDGGKVYWTMALFSSLTLAVTARYIFFSELQRSAENFYQKCWQTWFNFVGSMVGWLCLSVFLKSFTTLGINKIGFIHLLFLMVGGIGVSGLLPLIFKSVVDAVGDVMMRVVKIVLVERG